MNSDFILKSIDLNQTLVNYYLIFIIHNPHNYDYIEDNNKHINNANTYFTYYIFELRIFALSYNVNKSCFGCL